MKGSLADRWAKMNAKELRQEVFRFFRAQGMMQAKLYERIEELEGRIHRQREELIAAAEKRHKMARRIAELESERVAPPQRGAE